MTILVLLAANWPIPPKTVLLVQQYLIRLTLRLSTGLNSLGVEAGQQCGGGGGGDGAGQAHDGAQQQKQQQQQQQKQA